MAPASHRGLALTLSYQARADEFDFCDAIEVRAIQVAGLARNDPVRWAVRQGGVNRPEGPRLHDGSLPPS